MDITLTRFHFGLLIVAGSVAALAGALISQYGFGLYPCILCLYQRVPYVVAIVLGLLAAFAPYKIARPALFASAFVFAVGMVIAAYHVGVEQLWWESATGCTFDLKSDMSLDDLRAQIIGAPRALCTDIAWSLFGVSMAGYNVLYSGGLFVMSLFAAKRQTLRIKL